MKAQIAAFGLVAACLAPEVAAAQQQNCAARTAVIERLAGQYGESRQAIGMAPQGRVVEVFASDETGSWTITVTMPNGVTCLVASGQSYENLDEPVQPTGLPS